MGEAVPFRGEHLQELSASGEEGGEFGGGLVAQRPDRRANPVGKLGQHARIELVGLGEDAEGLGEIPHLARIDRHDGETGDRERAEDGGFVAARGLQDDQCRRQRLEPRDESGKGSGGVGHLPLLAGGMHGRIEVRLGDIETDEARGGHGPIW